MANESTNDLESWGGKIGSPNKEPRPTTKEVAVQQIDRLVSRAKKAPFVVDATLPMDRATSARAGEMMMERRSQIGAVVERAEKLRNYLENTEEIERERSRRNNEVNRVAGEMNSFAGGSGKDRSREGMKKHQEIVQSNGEFLREFEEKNIPYELLHEQDLIATGDINNNEFEKDYTRNIRSWIGVAKRAREEALEKIKEDNLPPELKEARAEIARLKEGFQRQLQEKDRELQEANGRADDLGQRLEESGKAREAAEERAKGAEQSRDRAIEMANGARERAEELEAVLAAARNNPPASPPEPMTQNLPGGEHRGQHPENRSRWQKIRHGLWRAFGNTAIGAMVGLGARAAGTAVTGGAWEAGAFAAGSVRSGIDRIREIGSREDFAHAMTQELRGGHRGLRQILEGWANLDAEAGRQTARGAARVAELIWNPYADFFRNRAADMIRVGLETPAAGGGFVAGIRTEWNRYFTQRQEQLAHRGLTLEEANLRIARETAPFMVQLASQLRYETQVGSFKIADLVRDGDPSISREQVVPMVQDLEQLVGSEARELARILQLSGVRGNQEDAKRANGLIQALSRNRDNRVDALRLVYAGAGTVAGGVKALGIAELAYQGTRLAEDIFHRIWPPGTGPVGTAPQGVEKIAMPSPDTGQLVSVRSGQTWGEILHNLYGANGAELWGWGPETGQLWADKYLVALTDPRNADAVRQYYQTASSTWGQTNAPIAMRAFTEKLGYDATAGTFNQAGVETFAQALRSGKKEAIVMAKGMAHVLRPTQAGRGIWLPK